MEDKTEKEVLVEIEKETTVPKDADNTNLILRMLRKRRKRLGE